MANLPVVVTVSGGHLYLRGVHVQGSHCGCMRKSDKHPKGAFVLLCGCGCAEFCDAYAEKSGAKIVVEHDASPGFPEGIRPNRPGGVGIECPRKLGQTGPVLTVLKEIMIGGEEIARPGTYGVLKISGEGTQVLIYLLGGLTLNSKLIEYGLGKLDPAGKELLREAESRSGEYVAA